MFFTYYYYYYYYLLTCLLIYLFIFIISSIYLFYDLDLYKVQPLKSSPHIRFTIYQFILHTVHLCCSLFISDTIPKIKFSVFSGDTKGDHKLSRTFYFIKISYVLTELNDFLSCMTFCCQNRSFPAWNKRVLLNEILKICEKWYLLM